MGADLTCFLNPNEVNDTMTQLLFVCRWGNGILLNDLQASRGISFVWLTNSNAISARQGDSLP